MLLQVLFIDSALVRMLRHLRNTLIERQGREKVFEAGIGAWRLAPSLLVKYQLGPHGFTVSGC